MYLHKRCCLAWHGSKSWSAGSGRTAEQTGHGVWNEGRKLLGGNWVRWVRLGWGRAQGSGIRQQCFPCEHCLSLRSEIFPPCSALSHKRSQKWLLGVTGTLASVLPPWGRASRSLKACLGLAWLCPPIASVPCAGAPGLVGREKSSWEEGTSSLQPPLAASCLAWGQHGHQEASALERTDRSH